MSRTKIALILFVLLVIALAWGVQHRRSAPPTIPFAKVNRERLVSTLVTNGKVEPSEWISVRAEREGAIETVDVEPGQRVARAALIATLEVGEARTEVASAEARLAQARAEFETVNQGGRSAELAEIENALVRARLDLEVAQRNRAALQRLQEKQAATPQEVADATQRVQEAQNAIQGLERKRTALVGTADRAAAEARVREAEAALARARQALELSRIRTPLGGVVYELAARPGAYVNPGDLIASVGNLKTVRVRVYVDEPELGRVATGMPVTITWDALPGRTWKGAVETTPTQVVALGTRQVGEVICTIENPGLELIPGTNVNAEIQSEVVENGLTIPKESVRRQGDQTGVYVLQGTRVVWRPVKLGASSVTRSQVVEGLSEGDAVALATEAPLLDGQEVQAEFRE